MNRDKIKVCILRKKKKGKNKEVGKTHERISCIVPPIARKIHDRIVSDELDKAWIEPGMKEVEEERRIDDELV
jgi:hypothetical protein